METKIVDVKGYTIVYETRDKAFYLKNTDGDVVGQGKTQDEVEAQADNLAKQNYKFPIPAFLESGLSLEPGRVTSVNLADQSVRFSYEDRGSGFSSRQHVKRSLKYGSGLHEATNSNQSIKKQVDILNQERDRLDEQIRYLINQLEKPIDLKYFNLLDLDRSP